jgi:hypothetical protein
MSITLNTKVYNPDVASSKDSIPYVGPGNNVTTVDKIDLFRTAPKPTKDFSGVARSRVRLTRTLTLTSALTPLGQGSVDTAINVPVGASSADVEAMLEDHAAGLAQAWALDLAYKLDLNA